MFPVKMLNRIDIDEPIAAPSKNTGGDQFSQADVAQLMDMGFNDKQAKKALKETVCFIVFLYLFHQQKRKTHYKTGQ